MKKNFILRTVHKDGKTPPLNKIIGGSYVAYKYSEQKCFADWGKIVKTYYPEAKDDFIKSIIIIVVSDDSNAIDKDRIGFIMSENGSTVERLN